MVDERLVKKLKDRSPARRRRALDAIAVDGHPDNLACLIEAISDPNQAVRVRARQHLKTLTGRDYAFSYPHWARWWRENASLTCRTCNRRLYDQKLYYLVKSNITSEPRELVITEEDLKQDHQAAIDELCEQLKGMAAEEIEEEVAVHLEYYLCVACKKAFVDQIKRPGKGTG